jgi:hypothetical protein
VDSEAQGKGKGATLPLRGVGFGWHALDVENHIVAVGANGAQAATYVVVARSGEAGR